MVLAGAVAVTGLGLLLAVEVQVARMGRNLPVQKFDLDVTGPPEIAGGSGRWLRLVWLGDSTAAGVGASEPAGAVPRVVFSRLGVPASVRVLATSGARLADVVRDQAPAVAALEPDIVLISVGANDTTHLTRRDAFRRRYEGLLRVLPRRSRVVLLGVPDMGSPPRLAQPLRAVAGWWGRRLDEEVARVARDGGASYVDIAGRTGQAFRRDTRRYFSADEFHPSDAGYLLWADAVMEVLVPLI